MSLSLTSRIASSLSGVPIPAQQQTIDLGNVEGKTIGFLDRDLETERFFSHFTTFLRKFGFTRLLRPYAQHEWISRAVGNWADRVKSVPLITEVKNREGEWTLAPDSHPIARWVDDPHPEYTRALIYELMTIWYTTSGEGLLVHPRNSITELPTRTFPCATRSERAQFKPVASPDGQIIVQWDYFVDGKKVAEYAFWEVTFFKRANPEKPLRGLGMLPAAIASAQLDNTAKQLQKTQLDNGGEPAGLLSTDSDLTNKQANRYRRRWESRHAGADKTGRIAVMSRGIKYQSIQPSNRDMQYLDLRKQTREDISAAFRVPFELMGFGKSTFSNFGEADRQFWKNQIMGLLEYYQEQLNERIVSPSTGGTTRVRFDTSIIEALEDDQEAKVGRATKLWESGVPMVEAARVVGLALNRFPGDDHAWLPFGRFDGGRMASVPRTPVDTSDPTVPPGTEDEGGSSHEDEEERAFGAWSHEKAVQYWKQYEQKQLAPFEMRFEGRLKKFFFAQRNDVLRRLKLAVAAQEAAEGRALQTKIAADLTPDDIERILFESEVWDDRLEERLSPVYVDAQRRAGEEIAETFGLVFDQEGAPYKEWLARKRIVIEAINEATTRQLRASLLAGIAASETVQELTDRIKDVFPDKKRFRRLRIARTESASAANGTRFLVMEANGVTRHQWLTAQDDEVRDSHRAQHLEIRMVGDEFSNGQKHPHDADVPDPGEYINCRCIAGPLPEVELPDDEEN